MNQDTYRFLGKEEWALGTDGVPTRRAARVIVISDDGYTLLMLGHDVNDPSYRWWFTVGGGMDPGETPLETAKRELFEETGFQISDQELIGPVIERDGLFKFTDRNRRQIEFVYLLYTPRFELDKSLWTESEKNLIDGLHWVPVDAISEWTTDAFIYPPELIDIILALHSNGWDGTCVKIDEYNENGA